MSSTWLKVEMSVRCFKMQHNGQARRPVLPGWKNLRNVVVKHEGHQHHDEHEADLKYCFLYRDTHIAAHHHLDEQHHYAAAIQDRERHQVNDGQIQTDHRHKSDEGRGALPGCLAGHLCDAHRP